uniref:Uncharacterized protein n=1 Tax=viral metagenome TaxID=1070528 RepID=A0A6C0IX84_9ZZZZ
MNIVKTLEQYNSNYVYFLDPIKNNIMNDGSFIRIVYSNNIFMLNGVFLLVNIDNIITEKYYNKIKCIFDVSEYAQLIQKIRCVEEAILNKLIVKNKVKKHKIYEQLTSGSIRIFSDEEYGKSSISFPVKSNNNKFMLKISGIWETDYEVGLTYKFIKIT